MTDRGTLLVVGSNPPSQTSGQRTRARVEQAATILGFERAVIANLFALPTYRSGGVTGLGGTADGWLEARPPLISALGGCGGVLLAYGTQEPSGASRVHHREQLRWLRGQIEDHELPCWWVGGAPRHPSRWQRYTHRQQGLPFTEALAQAFTRPRTDQWSRSAGRTPTLRPGVPTKTTGS